MPSRFTTLAGFDPPIVSCSWRLHAAMHKAPRRTCTWRPYAAMHKAPRPHMHVEAPCSHAQGAIKSCGVRRGSSTRRRTTTPISRSTLRQAGLHRPEHTRQDVRLHQDTSRSSSSSTSPINIVAKVYINVVFRRRRQKPRRRRDLRSPPPPTTRHAAAVIFDHRRRLRQDPPPLQNRCRRRP
jgi:hypothetical protein